MVRSNPEVDGLHVLGAMLGLFGGGGVVEVGGPVGVGWVGVLGLGLMLVGWAVLLLVRLVSRRW